MPFVIIIFGIILFVTAIKGTTGKLGALLASDVFGAGGYIYWIIAVLVTGIVGYIKPLKPVSDAFLALLIIALVLGHGGVWQKFNEAIRNIKASATTQSNATTSTNSLASPTSATSPIPLLTAPTLQV